ncbi:fumarylacetoacetate hydrolase family protein [Rhodococcus sp. NCIMB 12038]|jgi:2-keto-4-pentenoate hydratase/2-oxohepta-3-ene-1,7-dioic acid hydratase in catechol pathway|uniref:fumarylacetoacetate hydrolase family protein n=1 Tax=Rhodococcus sp. NCIMB 12038 TaxID=933800 RepID=UPI000B3D121F|nr:fumarylacetoacetate hydrolase family protein [Rhodococcus sp. NCIMB 12038]OUS83514.1 5-oxopent-3-ene-1,2,5-tricarboxylate decarboxylase [Rhodococcus sp. NCIMB 12038]
MRLVTYRSGANHLPGIEHGEYVLDLNATLTASGVVASAEFESVREFLEDLGDRLPVVSESVTTWLDTSTPTSVGTVADLHLGAPVQDPSKVLCVGLNYSDHVGETGRKFPSHPDVFAKFASSLIGPDDDIACSDVTENLDFEGELAIVIGKHCRRVSEDDALAHVAGLTVLNDITARDLQYRGTQWLAGKAVDGSTPVGPALVTLDEIGDPQSLDIGTRVNGEQMQHSNTKNMIFPIARIVSYISQFLALIPGDIIATGTPEGIGAKRQPPVWLRPGDVVEVEVEKVGLLRSTVR